jgi:hypothetical protein
MVFPFCAHWPERLKKLPKIAFGSNELDAHFPPGATHRLNVDDAALLLFFRDAMDEEKLLPFFHENGKLDTRSVGVDGQRFRQFPEGLISRGASVNSNRHAQAQPRAAPPVSTAMSHQGKRLALNSGLKNSTVGQ